MCSKIKSSIHTAHSISKASFGPLRVFVVYFVFANCVFLPPLLTGCGSRQASDNRPKGSVEGRVLVDGKPVSVEGVSLVLMPVDNTAAVSIPVLADGTFKGQAPIGRHFVSVSAGHTPDAGHGEGPKVGFGALFLSTESPLTITVAEATTGVDLEVGAAAAKKQEPNRRRLGPATTPKSH